jgi:cytochrome P450
MPMGYDTFGFGRRMCPGMELAIESIWLTVVSTLAVFDIAKAGQEGDGFVKYTSGLISHPLPFEVKITPRSKEAEDWIRSSVVAGV